MIPNHLRKRVCCMDLFSSHSMKQDSNLRFTYAIGVYKPLYHSSFAVSDFRCSYSNIPNRINHGKKSAKTKMLTKQKNLCKICPRQFTRRHRFYPILNTSLAYAAHPPWVSIMHITASTIYMTGMSRYAFPLSRIFRNT